MATAAGSGGTRPWIDHYPEGIEWDIKVDTTPVHEQVLAVCARTPDAVALEFMGAETRYGQLGQAINAFAGALQTQFGITKGHRVALMLPNTPFYVIAYYAVLRAGGTVVNCNPLYTVPELSHIVADSGAEVLITLDLAQLFSKAEALVTNGHVGKVIVCPFPRALPLGKRILYTLFKRKDLANVASSAIAGKTANFYDLIGRSDPPLPVRIDPAKDVAVQQYTGGTTGLPKGAMLSHANVAANMGQIAAWGCGVFDPPAGIVAVLPFFHIFAMTVCMNTPLCRGAKVAMLPRFELKPFLAMLERVRPTLLPAVPTLIQALSRISAEEAKMLGSVKVVISGGAALSGEIRNSFAKIAPDLLLAEGYGLTEASPVVCCSALRIPSKPMSIGLPIPATEVRFVDIETGKEAKLGERGELQVRGPQVMLGYYHNPEADADAFMDGWLRTGDVGYMDEDGYSFLVDRIKDLIICSGFNVYPRVIEEAILTHPEVDETNVIGVPDEYRGEAPVAFVKLKAGASITEAGLKKYLAERINKLEMPREIIFKESLPKTLIGKLSKKELREEYKTMKASQSEPA